MRVLLVSPTTGQFGGMEGFVIELGRYLSAVKDVEVRACFKLIAGHKVSDTLRRQLETSVARPCVVQRGSLELVRHLSWADVVHAQAASPDICGLARLLGKKLVVTVHNHLHGQHG